MSLRSINFNLVPVLRALQQHESVSRAAKELGLTQSAISAALARLRIALNDPLLVRAGGGMQLTPRAKELVEPVEELCMKMDGLLQTPVFDPKKLTRDFTIATADWSALHAIIGLTPQLKAEAPNVNLHFVDGVIEHPNLLASGEVDLMILPRAAVKRVAMPSLLIAHLFNDDYVMVMPDSHPLASFERPSEADTAPYRHLIFHFGLDPWDETHQHKIAGKPPKARISVRLQQFIYDAPLGCRNRRHSDNAANHCRADGALASTQNRRNARPSCNAGYVHDVGTNARRRSGAPLVAPAAQRDSRRETQSRIYFCAIVPGCFGVTSQTARLMITMRIATPHLCNRREAFDHDECQSS